MLTYKIIKKIANVSEALKGMSVTTRTFTLRQLRKSKVN